MSEVHRQAPTGRDRAGGHCHGPRGRAGENDPGPRSVHGDAQPDADERADREQPIPAPDEPGLQHQRRHRYGPGAAGEVLALDRELLVPSQIPDHGIGGAQRDDEQKHDARADRDRRAPGRWPITGPRPPERDDQGAERRHRRHRREAAAHPGRLGEGVDGAGEPGPRHPGPDEHHRERGHGERGRGPGRRPTGPVAVQGDEQGDPREQRRILDGVPRPVAAPAQLDVGPIGTEDETGAQQHGGDPDRTQARHGPRGGPVEGEEERDDRPEQPEIQDRRMDQHRRMLEDRCEAAALHRGDRERLERIGGDEHQEGRRHHDERPGGDRGAAPQAAQRGGGHQRGEDRCPEQERSAHARPETRQPVDRAARLPAVVDDVGEGEVGSQEGGPERTGRHEGAGRGGPEGGAGRRQPAAESQSRGPGRGEDDDHDGGVADVGGHRRRRTTRRRSSSIGRSVAHAVTGASTNVARERRGTS